MIQKKDMQILLIEDNPGDVRLTQEAFKEGRLKVDLDYVMDGEEALKYLRKENPYTESPTPDLILLDLNLPRWDGKELLKIIKSDPLLRFIPVVVLTTSIAEKDVIESYSLHANCYLNKPVDFDRFFEVIQKIEDFWLNTVILPGNTD